MSRVLAVLLLLLLVSPGSDASAQEKDVIVALIGDSTVTDQSGWGKAFAGRFSEKVTVRNFAVGGRSSKSWYDEKRLPKALKAKPNFVLIQFGHNDQPGKGPKRETDPATTYREYLKKYVEAFRKIGAKPIILSSVTRRLFDKKGKVRSTLGPWAEGAKAAAAELKVPFIELHAVSVKYHNKIGPEESARFNPKEGDATHFNSKGAEAIAGLIVQELKVVAGELAAYLK